MQLEQPALLPLRTIKSLVALIRGVQLLILLAMFGLLCLAAILIPIAAVGRHLERLKSSILQHQPGLILTTFLQDGDKLCSYSLIQAGTSGSQCFILIS